MENSNVFTYSYSAKRNREIESIREKYLPKEENKLDTLRRLDNKVQSAGMVQGLTVGIIGCLIFGIGMCFGLDALAGADWLTLLFCAIGAVIMLPAYPIYKHISKKTRAELAPEILSLTEELMTPSETKN